MPYSCFWELILFFKLARQLWPVIDNLVKISWHLSHLVSSRGHSLRCSAISDFKIPSVPIAASPSTSEAYLFWEIVIKATFFLESLTRFGSGFSITTLNIRSWTLPGPSSLLISSSSILFGPIVLLSIYFTLSLTKTIWMVFSFSPWLKVIFYM